MSLQRITELMKDLDFHSRKVDSIGHRLNASITLFGAACSDGNVDEQEKMRNDMHTLIDAQLDALASVHRVHADLRNAGVAE